MVRTLDFLRDVHGGSLLMLIGGLLYHAALGAVSLHDTV